MDIPKYRRLKYELEETWRNFPAHRALPSERDIRRQSGLSLETVRKTLAELEAEGRIYRLPNKGSYISPPVRRKQFLVVGLEIAGADLGVARFLFGMNRLVHEKRLGFLPFFVESGEFLEQYRELSVIYRDLAAVIFMRDIGVLEKTRAELSRKEIPFLFYGSDTWESKTRDVHRILFSEREIAETAAAAIRQSKSRKVVVVLPQPHGVMDERLRVFQILANKKKLSVIGVFRIPQTWEKPVEKKTARDFERSHPPRQEGVGDDLLSG
ncbi:MAG: GntR family transcriptional regulator [Spirochaetia bacterium]|nr:GntR family transcriptional regulator [Spirochaetia bacterium]